MRRGTGSRVEAAPPSGHSGTVYVVLVAGLDVVLQRESVLAPADISFVFGAGLLV